MAGNDLNDMSPEILEVLTNKGLIAVNQDVLGSQGVKVRDDGDFEIWSKELTGGDRAVALLNRSDKKATMAFTWDEVGLSGQADMRVRDLWKKEDGGVSRGKYSSEVDSHDVVVVRISAARP